MVKTELGHASVFMTEKYADFDKRKLEEDFPSLLTDKWRHIIRHADTNQGNTHIPIANYG